MVHTQGQQKLDVMCELSALVQLRLRVIDPNIACALWRVWRQKPGDLFLMAVRYNEHKLGLTICAVKFKVESTCWQSCSSLGLYCNDWPNMAHISEWFRPAAVQGWDSWDDNLPHFGLSTSPRCCWSMKITFWFWSCLAKNDGKTQPCVTQPLQQIQLEVHWNPAVSWSWWAWIWPDCLATDSTVKL